MALGEVVAVLPVNIRASLRLGRHDGLLDLLARLAKRGLAAGALTDDRNAAQVAALRPLPARIK